MSVFLEGAYSAILLLHLLVTFVLVGAMTHNLLCVVDYARGRFNRQNLEHRYLRWAWWAYLAVYILGALIYPAFRIYVRFHCFDKDFPWATGLFEVKEHWGALGLAILAGLYLLRKGFTPSKEKDKLWLYIPLTVLLNLALWYKVLIGSYLSLLRGSW